MVPFTHKAIIMNNKEFINRLATDLHMAPAQVQHNVTQLLKSMASLLADENSLTVQNFGTFEVRKRLERIVVNPATRQKMLVPPKMVLGFKPSASLKNKIKS